MSKDEIRAILRDKIENMVLEKFADMIDDIDINDYIDEAYIEDKCSDKLDEEINDIMEDIITDVIEEVF